MITAMTTFLLLMALLAGLAGLVRYVRHDAFASHFTPYPDDLVRP
jgi:hypothetical protein